MAERILIVDDDLETLRLVGLALQRQGYEILAANNGAQALESAKAEQPDLILLDVMMPDMDGYEVARKLRAEPSTASTPILMFTAKGQVDDKVPGYEAGVDDYLTKPTHPAELTAHIKVLLGRTSRARVTGPLGERGQIVAFLSSKGGTGVSTLALNTGIYLAQKTKSRIVAVELHPGQGNWGLELGFNKPENINHLLHLKPGEINPAAIDKEIQAHGSGLQILLSSYRLNDVNDIQSIPQIEALIKQLSLMSSMVILDIGINFFPGIDKVLALSNEAVIVVEPNPITVMRTKVLLEDLYDKGFGKSRLMTIVLINRVRSDIQLSWTQVQEALGQPVSQVISPAPELAYQAALRTTPMILVQPTSLTAQEIGKVADLLEQHLRKK
ncbi:MAG TPA: response regulator [Anaerolineaceae bacterium]